VKKRMNKHQKDWQRRFESETGFDMMWMDEFHDGSRSFIDVAKANVHWYEDHTSDIYLRVSADYPGEQP
jgi:hypothetical protein